MHRRRLALVAAVCAGAIGVGWIGLGGIVASRAGDPTGSDAPLVDAGVHPITQAVEAGRHVRIDGPRGPIHAWIPAGYHADTGATIVYLHGYYDAADTAWVGHALPEQFAMSALNALFIVPESPVAAKTPINYPELGEVIRLVEDKAGVTRGAALTAVVGHSGAFRTIDRWLDEPLVDQIVMIDAMYADQDAIEGWYRASPRHRVIVVGEDTLLWTEEFARDVPETLILDRVPPTYELWPPEARTARSVYVRAQYMHMPLVTDGIVLPSLLRLLPVELL
ncbi:MAG: hypothetical protein NT062_13840, partial [Proteobacteria bacterium]|nr:hypothetical protein [Pseudomonadota bacterium]